MLVKIKASLGLTSAAEDYMPYEVTTIEDLFQMHDL
jgi:hypothetical protein